MTAALLLLAFVAMAMAVVTGAKWPRTWLVLTVTGCAAALVAALAGADWEWRSGFLMGGEPLHLRLDGLSALFLALLAVVGAAGAIYSREYWSDHHYPASAPRGRVWWSALLLGMGTVLTVSNGLHFLIGWELFTVSAYFLVTLDRQRREVRAAGWLYLAASHAGTVCLFAFFALLAARTGSWDLGPMRGDAGLGSLFWLALIGFGVKSGVFPLHIWLPSAHANAPSHVSAIMSGVAIKMGVYGIIRFSGWLPVPPAAGWVVIGLGSISAVLGIAFALAQNDFKRLLAYCSVENIGVIFVGLGAALLAGDAPWGRLALAGALFHVWNHGAFKALLFFAVGSVLHTTGTREMSRLGGLWRAMPWTAGLFAVGAVAVSGLPPLNGFVSEWLVYLGLFDAVTSKEPSAWAAIPAAILLAMAGALALATFVKAGSMIFLGAPRTQIAAKARECGGWMRGPMLGLAGVCLAIGLAPVLFWPAVARAIGAWRPAWATAELPAPLFTLGFAHLGLFILLAAAGVFLWRKVKSNGLRRGPTWDCGYATPTARMQYSSGSFGGLSGEWFAWILRPVLKLKRPGGPFPVDAIHVERVPETILERVVTPLGGWFILLSTAVRRLQHGRLQAYILYVVVGLVALGVFVFLGGEP
ncbi:MAG: proton-conducting transporter membrane subunit [Luteolibacter sp.]